MRLLINYNNIAKILPEVSTYMEMRKFICLNFHDLPERWVVEYMDTDGDNITLASELDIENMLATTSSRYIKVYVLPADYTQEINIGNSGCDLVEKIKKSEDKVQEVKEDVVQKPNSFIDIKETQSEIKLEEPEMKEEVHSSHGQRMYCTRNREPWRDFGCGQRKQNWKEMIHQKMAKFIDERIETLIPCITKQVEKRLSKKESGQVQVVEKKVDGPVHQISCQGCKAEHIVGIRYKCNSCVKFNFCEKCEKEIDHPHNMIKMRKPEEEKKVEAEEEKRPEGREHFGPFGKFGFFGGGFPFNGVNGDDREQGRRYHHGHHHRKEQKDWKVYDNLALTKKTFKMSDKFGGKPEDYTDFVNARINMRPIQIMQEYAQEKNLDMSKFEEEKIEMKSSKLGYYYKKDPKDFWELVKANISLNLKQLINLIEKPKEKIKKVQQKVLKMTGAKVEEKKADEQGKKEELEVKEVKVQVPIDNPAKKAAVIIELKDLFGDRDSYKYLNFYEEHKELEQGAIIMKYLENLEN